MKTNTIKHRMLFAHSGLKAFLGQDPREWFLAQGFSYSTDQIGFNLQHNRTLKKERFDFPFNSEAIKMVMDQLTVLTDEELKQVQDKASKEIVDKIISERNTKHPEADEDTPV